MAVLYITEYIDVYGSRQVSREPPLKEQTLAIGAVVASNPFDPRTTLIRVSTDAICSVLVGAPGTTATTSSGRMPANTTEYRGVSGGQVISVITNT